MGAETPRRGRPVLHALLPWTCGLAALALGACGNLTAGGATAEVAVSVAGDAADPAVGQAAPAVLSREDASDTDDEPEGELEMEFLLALVTEGGGTVALTTDEARVRVRFPREPESEVVTRTVPADRYTALRVTFTEIEVEVEAGLVVDGVPVAGPVEVELEDEALVVDVPLELDLDDDEAAELLVDMNATGWLAAVDPEMKTVSGAVLAQLIRVVRR